VVRHIPYAKAEKKLPVVLSQREATRLLLWVANMKHLTMLLLGYSSHTLRHSFARLVHRFLDHQSCSVFETNHLSLVVAADFQPSPWVLAKRQTHSR
jgi:hypothetical protein